MTTDPTISLALGLHRAIRETDARNALHVAATQGVSGDVLRSAWNDWRSLRASETHVVGGAA